MSKLSLVENRNPKPKAEKEESEPHKTTRESFKKVRDSIVQKVKENPRQKLRINDLYPDKQLIKEVTDNEYKYFVLLTLPVIVIALLVLFQRYNLYERLTNFLLQIL